MGWAASLAAWSARASSRGLGGVARAAVGVGVAVEQVVIADDDAQADGRACAAVPNERPPAHRLRPLRREQQQPDGEDGRQEDQQRQPDEIGLGHSVALTRKAGLPSPRQGRENPQQQRGRQGQRHDVAAQIGPLCTARSDRPADPDGLAERVQEPVEREQIEPLRRQFGLARRRRRIGRPLVGRGRSRRQRDRRVDERGVVDLVEVPLVEEEPVRAGDRSRRALAGRLLAAEVHEYAIPAPASGQRPARARRRAGGTRGRCAISRSKPIATAAGSAFSSRWPR